MKKTLFIIMAFIFCNGFSHAQRTDRYTIVSYNVENLFDTVKTSGKNDADFTPDGKKKWNTEKYFNKLKNIAKVISSIDSCGCPAIVGLVEVENKKVVEDLISADTLNKCKYSIVHFESGDPRGIDNAIIYRKDIVKLINGKNFLMAVPRNGYTYRHDFLYSIFGIEGDTIHVFLNHFKARSSKPSDSTEVKRVLQAKYLKTKIDSLQGKDSKAKIIIMGDFNDNPSDSSIAKVLYTFPFPPAYPVYFLNPFFSIFEKGIGTYKYIDEWNLFDQIILSSGLNDAPSGFKYIDGSAAIFNPEWLYYTDKKTEKKKPDMLFSDHFPVYIVIEKKK
ncbi:MAG: endonuclease/exonuclease/phosphatase family protein [Bacteroidota bacterium]